MEPYQVLSLSLDPNSTLWNKLILTLCVSFQFFAGLLTFILLPLHMQTKNTYLTKVRIVQSQKLGYLCFSFYIKSWALMSEAFFPY